MAMLPLVIGMAAARPAPALSDAMAVQQQAAAAVARGLRTDASPEQIESNLRLLGSPPSLPSGSTLRLVSAKAGFTPGSWLLRLDCSSRRDCLPFYAVLGPGDADANVANPQDSKRSWPGLTGALKPPARAGPRTAPVARSGDRVSLVEELSGMRLQVKVVCLQSGGLGDRIRVQNLATHRVLLATIAGKDLVRVE
jgi:hypothetical protein